MGHRLPKLRYVVMAGNADDRKGLFALVDTVFFLYNIAKVADGGWVPLLVAGVIFTVLTTWAKGRGILRAQLEADAIPRLLYCEHLHTRSFQNNEILQAGSVDHAEAEGLVVTRSA